MWWFSHAHFELYKNEAQNMSNINISILHMSKINIEKWILLKVLFFGQFRYPIFEERFTLHN
jgi:hypothetical protein